MEVSSCGKCMNAQKRKFIQFWFFFQGQVNINNIKYIVNPIQAVVGVQNYFAAQVEGAQGGLHLFPHATLLLPVVCLILFM